MNYTIIQKDGGLNEIFIPTESEWGTICFAWEDSNTEFTTALEQKGIEIFVELLIADPNTAYTLFTTQ